MNAKTIVSPFSAEELKEIIGKFTSNTNTNSDFQPTSAATSGFSTATHPTPWSSEAASEFPQTNVSTIPPQYTPQYAACGPVGATVMPQLPNRFPIQAVPELIREAMIDALHFSQAPDALVTGCALSAVSLACQNFVDVERLPGLVGPVSLSIAIIATTGERKTFVDSLFTKPFRDFDEEQSKRTEALRPRYEAALTAWKQQCRAITSAISTAAKKGQSVEGLTYRLEELNANKPKEPYSRQYIVDDSTPAELKFKLRHPFSSVGIFSDEAKLLVKSGLLNNFAMLNKLWDAGTISVGRRSSESFRISNVRVTTSLGIHPYLFFKHFCDDGSEARPVGNLARNLIAFPPSTIGDRPITEQRSSYPHLLNFQTRIAELIRLEHSAIEAGKHTRRLLKFTREAQQRWIEAFNFAEWMQGPGRPLSAINDFCSKLGDNIARVAALFHHFEGYEGDEISLDTLSRAIQVGNWYLEEFSRIFSPAMPMMAQDQLDAITLENWLVKNFIKHRCNWIDKSDLERKATIRLVARLEPAISILMQQGLMSNITDPPPPGRKAKIRYGLNVPYFEQAAARLQNNGLA